MSQFLVSARKYRPTQFEDVVGQLHVAKTLKNALSTGKVAHAFLFCGPRGVGKTTCARILAKTLNCLSPKNQEACDTCASCTAFNNNASFNIVELDAASNNSVDAIRTLIDQVRFQPQSGKYKIFIIDEVHMLTTQAFNAFLKTLEEPPPYAIFILATTEKHKIIPTILSRCQIFDFKRIGVVDMVQHLKGICAKENIKAEDDALHIIAQKADGALRDALSIFDRVSGAANGNLRYDDVIDNLNVLDYDYFFQITDAILAEDVSTLLLLFDQILAKGFEPDIFMNGLAGHLRDIMVCKDEDTVQLLEVSEGLKDRYRRQAQVTPLYLLVTALGYANECDINYKMARNKRLHVEMTLIRMNYIGRAVAAHTGAGLPPDAQATEKKKPNSNIATQAAVSVESVPTIVKPDYNQVMEPEEQPYQQQDISSEPLTNSFSDEISEESPLQPTHTALAIVETPPKVTTPKIAKAAGKIGLSLDAFEAEVNKEVEEEAKLVSLFTLENVLAFWQKCAQEEASQSLRSILNDARLVIHEDRRLVEVTVFSETAKYSVNENSRIQDLMRIALKEKGLKMEVIVDKSQLEAKQSSTPNKPITAKEKWNVMLAQNPALSVLQERLGLELEE